MESWVLFYLFFFFFGTTNSIKLVVKTSRLSLCSSRLCAYRPAPCTHNVTCWRINLWNEPERAASNSSNHILRRLICLGGAQLCGRGTVPRSAQIRLRCMSSHMQHDGEQESRRRKGTKEALLSHEGVSPALQRSADLGVSCEL